MEAAERGGYDAVLMDVTLSGLDGIEATRRIRALPGKAGQVPVIGISGRTESGDEDAARAAGMNFYFAKPVSPGQTGAGAGCCDRSSNRCILRCSEASTKDTLAVSRLRAGWSSSRSARSTMRTTSDMMRFSSKSFGV